MTGRAIKRSRRLAPAPSRATANRAREWRLHAVTAERAVTAIRPGDRVFVGSACATPRTLLGALEAMVTPLAGVQLVHFLTDGAGTERDGRCRSAFRHRVFYVGRDMRRLAPSGEVDYVPLSLTEVPRLLKTRRLAFDVALVQVSPPNREGMCAPSASGRWP